VFAVKHVRRARCTKQDVRLLVDEIAVLKLLQGQPNVCLLQHVFCNTSDCYIVMELCSGDLLGWVSVSVSGWVGGWFGAHSCDWLDSLADWPSSNRAC
jgi:serine/threonine protein kinase